MYGILAGDSPGGDGDARALGGFAEGRRGYGPEIDDQLRDVAMGIDAVFEEHRSIIDWRENLDVQREMRRDIKRLLRETGRYDEDDLDELVRQVVEVARRRLA